ncbi:hypothetical protein [Nocardiopsis sp. M1B1]|uniref:hypothetical protein n=1 Tax=Nocardiopsis sp. M1B1 TaxID=3450454 RepID=UPI00403A158D
MTAPVLTPAAPALSSDMRRVLDAPRGQRFGRPGARAADRTAKRPAPVPSPPLVSLGRTPRERELLARMPDTPRLRYRLTHGDVPAWMIESESRKSRPREASSPDPEPRPRPRPRPGPERGPAPGDGPGPEPLPVPRPRRERTPPPPLPRRSDRPRRTASHRKPRRRLGWTVAGYALATAAGALAHHLAQLLA